MRAFLQVTKEAVGYPICDVILITGNTEVYSNAWNAVIGKPTHRLMCAWHIDCAWIKNLKHFLATKRTEPNGCNLPFVYGKQQYDQCLPATQDSTPQCATSDGQLADRIAPTGK